MVNSYIQSESNLVIVINNHALAQSKTKERKHTLEPAATVLIVVLAPVAPTLQRISVEVVSVTGEL